MTGAFCSSPTHKSAHNNPHVSDQNGDNIDDLVVHFRVQDTGISCGDTTAIEDRALYRYQASLVIEKSMAVIDSLFSSAGGASVFRGSEIQQRFLDIHTARAHVANNPTPFARNLGALGVGAENGDFFI